MSTYRAWAAKQKGNPALLLIAAVGFTFGLYSGYRYSYAPWARRRRLAQAESYAQELIAKESKDR